MTDKTTLTFVLMDAPFESARTSTAFRLMDIAAKRGYDINVFAYEGAVFLPFAPQAAHPNAVHGHDAAEEDHPLSKDWVAAIQQSAADNGGRVDWINCGLCVDERGAGDAIEGIRRGGPPGLWEWTQNSNNTLVIGTR